MKGAMSSKEYDNTDYLEAQLTLKDNPSVVDIVKLDEGRYLLFRSNGSPEECGPVESLPIPWAIPMLADVEASQDMPSEVMFERVRKYLAQYSVMPLPEYFDLFTAWEFLSYVHDQFTHIPMLYFFGEQERGKSRTGKAIAWASFRGCLTDTENEAYALRLGPLGATVFVDVTDFTGKARKRGSVDIWHNRFEKGLDVFRVDSETPGLKGLRKYPNFGPTIIATNRAIDQTQASRGLLITPPLVVGKYPAPTEEAGLKIRAMLTAWRQRMLDGGPEFPDIDGCGTGRFEEITRPIRQVTMLVAPERIPQVDKALAHLHKASQQLRAQGNEANIVRAILSLGKTAVATTEDIQRAFLKVVDWQAGQGAYTTTWVGRQLAALGFEQTKIREDGEQRRGWKLDPKLLKDLRAKWLDD